MADGTVTIETKLDNSGAEKGLNDLKKEVESSSKSTAQEIDKASDQAQKSVEEVAKSAEKTGKQVEKSAKDSASKAGQAAKQGADSAAKGTESASTKMQQSHKKVKDTAKYPKPMGIPCFIPFRNQIFPFFSDFMLFIFLIPPSSRVLDSLSFFTVQVIAFFQSADKPSNKSSRLLLSYSECLHKSMSSFV